MPKSLENFFRLSFKLFVRESGGAIRAQSLGKGVGYSHI